MMDSLNEVQKSSSQLKKCRKKLKKCVNMLEEASGIKCHLLPTKHLAICNAGLSNGLSEEVLIESFLPFGPLDKIVMLVGKSYCFISFKNVKDSTNAYDSLNFELKIAQDNKPIYLAYTESVPEVVDEINFNDRPPGLVLIENFITDHEEICLLSLNDFNEADKCMKHRQVKHYGFEFRYDTNNVDKDAPLEDKIPDESQFLWDRLKNHGYNFIPDQLTVNCYKSGQGIPAHVDTHSAFEDPLISLSLGSDIVMDFKNGDARLSVFLPRRSLAIFSGEARYNWTHGITPRKLDVIPSANGLSVNRRGTRVSYTFRKIRKGECDCQFKDKCDSYRKRSTGICDELAAKLENQHVHEVYENIASHFSDTRHKPWPNVLEFVRSFELGSVLIDVGCGNGKYLKQNAQVFDIGCDRSFGLLSVCRDRGFEVFNCDCLYLPFKDQVADGVISIAVLHHLSTQLRRKQALKEIIRILSIKGRALIYVWAKNQNKTDKSTYLKQDRKNRKLNETELTVDVEKSVSIGECVELPVHTNRKQFKHQDLLVPWKLKTDTVGSEFLRYYHVFDEAELENMIEDFDEVKVIRSYYDEGNWCVIFERIK